MIYIHPLSLDYTDDTVFSKFPERSGFRERSEQEFIIFSYASVPFGKKTGRYAPLENWEKSSKKKRNPCNR